MNALVCPRLRGGCGGSTSGADSICTAVYDAMNTDERGPKNLLTKRIASLMIRRSLAARIATILVNIARLPPVEYLQCPLRVNTGNKLMPGAQPHAHAYCGHQFGSFAGQLGDGAAMYLGEVEGPSGRFAGLPKLSKLEPFNCAILDGDAAVAVAVKK